MILEGYSKQEKPIKVTIEGKKIVKVEELDSTEENHYILPGFIDIHTHGGYGTDFMDASVDQTTKYLKNLPAEGTTSIYHTSVTDTDEHIDLALENVIQFIEKPPKNMTRILGIHLEGVFINPAKKGAHDPSLLRPLTTGELDHLIKVSKNHIKIVTYAPELVPVSVTRYMHSKGIIASAGHTMADFDTINRHAKYGLNKLTHLYNAMLPPVNKRENGASLAAFLTEGMYTEIIADGVHVTPPAVTLAYRNVPKDKMLLITDSTSPKGMPDGDNYKLGGLKIIKKGNTIYLEDMTSIAGSISAMIDNFRNYINFTGASIEEASDATSINQAKLLGLEEKLGKIAPNYEADILILDKETLEIEETICLGEIAYKQY